MSRAESVKGTSGSEDSRNGTLLPRPDGKIKPLPPLPTQASVDNERVKSLVPGQRERQETEGMDRDTSVPAAPPQPDSLTGPKPDDGLGMLTLQRSKPANMKEKVEKWRERRSDIAVSDRNHLENRRINKLK